MTRFGTSTVPVISLYRNDPKQVGDQASTPAAYAEQIGLPWLAAARRVDIEARDLLGHDLAGSVVIIGGGGLTFDNFQLNMCRVIDMEPRALIWWGAGYNIHLKPNPYKPHGKYEDLTPQELMYPDYLRNPPFDAIGVRDPESTQAEPEFGKEPLPYVPCVSAMQPALDHAARLPPHHRAIVYIQKDPLMPRLDGLPTMSNATHADHNRGYSGDSDRFVEPARTAARAIRFIGEGEVVITNSYHGALWGQEIGRPVVVVDGWSTKFHKLPVQEAILAVKHEAVLQDLSAVLEEATKLRKKHSDRFIGLLASARRRNIEFGHAVERVLEAKGIEPASLPQ